MKQKNFGITMISLGIVLIASGFGRIVWHTNAIDTLIETLRIIGFERTSKVEDTMHVGYTLVSRDMRPQTSGNIWQHECDG